MKYLLPLALFILLSNSGFGCGNEYGQKLDGTRIHTRFFYLSDRMTHHDTALIQSSLAHLTSRVAEGTANFRIWSDIASYLMKLGNIDSAMTILIPLLAEHPGEYHIQANLGTVYELTGELDSALKYISSGYDINKASHLGSEWIHIYILKAKIKEKADPGWMRLNRIITVKQLLAKIDTGRLDYSVRKINNDIMLQLRTRVPFTPAPNKVICNLLHTLGDFNKAYGSYENALLAYSYGLKFSPLHFRERPITESIKKLNRAREEMGESDELAFMFRRMMRRSKISPSFLLIGLEEEAEVLDAHHLMELAILDSMKVFTFQIDSVTEYAILQREQSEIQIESSEKMSYIYLLIGLMLGAVVTLLIMRKRR